MLAAHREQAGEGSSSRSVPPGGARGSAPRGGLLVLKKETELPPLLADYRVDDEPGDPEDPPGSSKPFVILRRRRFRRRATPRTRRTSQGSSK